MSLLGCVNVCMCNFLCKRDSTKFWINSVKNLQGCRHSVSSMLSSNRNVHENKTGRIGSLRLDDLRIHIWIQFLEALCTTERKGNISTLVVTVSNTLTWISISSWITGSTHVDVEGFSALAGVCILSLLIRLGVLICCVSGSVCLYHNQKQVCWHNFLLANNTQNQCNI